MTRVPDPRSVAPPGSPSFPDPCRREGGRTILILPRPDFDSYVRLAADELRQYGGSSIQVMRRLRYLLEDLLHTAPELRHDEIRRQLALLDGSVGRQFPGRADREFAVLASAQGHGPR